MFTFNFLPSKSDLRQESCLISLRVLGLGGLLSDTGGAAHIGGFFHIKFPTYGSISNLNLYGTWIAFSEPSPTEEI